jgi:SAM-dependent methyltransferase
LNKLPPAVTALLLQIAALAIVLTGAHQLNLETSPLTLSLLAGLIAMALSYLAGLASWWLLIQLIFAPCLILTLTLNISPSIYLAAFLIMLAVYWSTYQTQVPLYLSSNKVWVALEDFLPENDGFRFIDLGSGLGGVLTHLAEIRTDGHYTGIESAPLPWLISWLRTRRFNNCAVHWGSIWDEQLAASNLAQYDLVFAYLSPVPMERLWHKARTEMRPGTVFISSTFTVPDQLPDQTLQIDDMHQSTLLVWRM